jgi:MFS family permease
MVATLGFAVTACLFFVMSRIDPSAGTFTPTALALLHFVAGIGAGAGITMVHGTLGQSKNPHGAFSAANLGIGIFGIVFFATVPGLMASMGVAAVFLVACAIVGIAAILALVAYPKAEEAPNAAEAQSLPHDPQLRLVIAGIV